MTAIAFYAPLKSPDHPTPSGDRQIARNLQKALARALNGSVHLASKLRSFEPRGAADDQAALLAQAGDDIARIIKTLPDVALWVSYHNYYKAPDLIGPAVSRARGIPYVLIEATRARKRLTGPWADFARRAEAASDAATVIFHFTDQDRVALERDRPDTQQLVHLPPFLDRASLPPASATDGPMLAVGMMRPGDKLASYTLIAQTLAALPETDWHLQIVGDGDARAEVHRLFEPFGDRVSFLGAKSASELETIYSNSSMMLWPGVNEAFGMVYLEAQAAGLPVLAQLRPGVQDVLAPGAYPSVADGIPGLAAHLRELLANPAHRLARGQMARDTIAERHLRPAAEHILRDTLSPLIGAQT